MTILVGVDIGGTNTDLIMMDTETSEFRVAKVPTVVGDQAEGLLSGLDALGVSLGEVGLLVHGTTIATNAAIERKGASCGLITTTGFRDVLELRRRDRPSTYGLGGSFTPLIARRFRAGVDERISAEGEVLQTLDEEGFLAAVRQLKSDGCEVLVLSFINAYANPAHERRAKQLASEIWDEGLIVTSSETLPTIREFERTSTTVVGGYVTPIISRYLNKLTDRLKSGGYNHELLVVQSNGGVMTARTATRRAGHTLLSGPAAGVSAASLIAGDVGEDQVISADIGGTSLDICIIRYGRAATTQEKQLEFGIPLALPMLDVDAIGVGGGSFARIDGTGLLNVGPDSAGANPGPVCYGKGNDIPTTTDANLVLGLIDPERAIGKSSGIRMDRELARAAIDAKIARPMGLSVEDAAEAILKIASAKSAGHIRKKLLEKGLDPRSFAMIAFGGGGPLLANRILRDADLRRVIIPAFPGITSAMGCLIGNLQHDFMRSAKTKVAESTPEKLQATFQEDIATGCRLLGSEGVGEDDILVDLGADMAYRGQSNTLPVHFTGAVEDLTPASVIAAFERAYNERFGRLLPETPIMIVNARTVVRQKQKGLSFSKLFEKKAGEMPQHTTAKVYYSGSLHDVKVFNRHELPLSAKIQGPAILHQLDTTFFVEPGYTAEVHHSGNIILEKAQ